MEPQARLAELMARLPLPGLYSLSDTYFDRVLIGGRELSMAGLIAKSADGQIEAVGAAAQAGETPVERAYYELLERICTALAEQRSAASFPKIDPQGQMVGEVARSEIFPQSPSPNDWVYSKSNGIALHADAPRACRSAMLELVERDALLRAWYGLGEVRPLPTAADRFAWADGLYQITACEFDPRSRRLASCIGILALPQDPSQAPLSLASAARSTPDEALEAAEAELLQRMAFLWGEEIPEQPPVFTPHVDYHLAYHLVPSHHAPLADFFARGHRHLPGPPAVPTPLDLAGLHFADLTPEDLAGGLRVVRALHTSAQPLRFGREPGCFHLPAPLAIHPVS